MSSAFSISQFCLDHGITPPTYYKLRKQGLGPVEMRVLNIVRITSESAAEWRKARENPTASEADAVAKNVQALHTRAKRAAKRAVESDRHVSRRGARE